MPKMQPPEEKPVTVHEQPIYGRSGGKSHQAAGEACPVVNMARSATKDVEAFVGRLGQLRHWTREPKVSA